MLFSAHQSFDICDRSYGNMVKKDIAKMAEALGFKESHLGRIDILLSEMCSNLLKHGAVNGEVLVKTFHNGESAGIEIICADNGPGMLDPERMMKDGVSTYGSQGEGLGAIKRLSDEFELFSLKGTGTIILSRLFVSKPVSKTHDPLDIAAVMVPKKGETQCGDGWAFQKSGSNYVIAAIDGLGHGHEAHTATNLALQSFLDSQNSPHLTLRNMHLALKKTRGAVASIATISLRENLVIHCGIGNISSRVISKESHKNLVSYNGTVGYVIPATFHDHQHVWNVSSFLVMHSDGIKSRWEASKYPNLENYSASMVAAIIYKDNARGNDDSLVVVAKRNKRNEKGNS